MAGQADPGKAARPGKPQGNARQAQMSPPSRDTGLWAGRTDRLTVVAKEGAHGANVAGRRLTGPVQGFGQLWHKTYRISIPAAVSPRQAITTWKAHFAEFWPAGSTFAGPLTRITPGDVALLDITAGAGIRMSTGVFVLYADEESFTFMTPQGHQFAGWITFSAQQSGEQTIIQADVLMRANDPLYEIAMPVMHRKEDRFWTHALTALGERLGVTGAQVELTSTRVDPRRQWRHAGNVWHNAMVRSVLQSLAAPLTQARRQAPTGR